MASRSQSKTQRPAAARVEAIPGVAPAMFAKFAKLGLHRRFDLVLHLPLRYEDETTLSPIAGAGPGTSVQVEATVLATDIKYRPRRTLVVTLGDDQGILILRFLNFYGSQVKQFTPGKTVRAFGELREGFLGREMVHPRYRIVEPGTPLPNALTPIYPATAGVSQALLRKSIEAALGRENLSESLPPELVA